MPATVPADELRLVMARVADGDRGAFALLYDATARTVFGIVLRVLRDRAQAEEVTQEVYLEVWSTAARFDPDRGSPAAWLNVIAHRRAVDRVRSAQRSTQRERRQAPAPSEVTQPDVSEIVVAREEADGVRRALAALPEAQRTALAMAYYDGRTQREVAELLDVPLGTVKTRTRDALRRLRGSLEEPEEVP